SLAVASSPHLLRIHNITHIVSVCLENPFNNSSSENYPPPIPPDNHLVIPVEDCDYVDILLHLPKACGFIDSALRCTGHGRLPSRVLVHCAMGVSRSATVVCAFLMRSLGVDAWEALQLVRKGRPCAHPNYGFMKQLHVWAECSFCPSPRNTAYRLWKRRHAQDVTRYLSFILDTIRLPCVDKRLAFTR
ncbi:phosphatases II, partial [Fistulina hepatica ATCC 64428]